MIRRTVIKTVLICCGVFLLGLSATSYALFSRFPLDMEKRLNVAVFAVNAEEGEVLEEGMIMMKGIRESALNDYMVRDVSAVVGKRLMVPARKGDYVASYRVAGDEEIYSEDEKLIAIELATVDRMANIIGRGSYVDIVLKYDKTQRLPQIVLSKVKVEELVDTNGDPVERCSGGKAVYARLRLGKAQRDRLYAASDMGRLLCETYASPLQKAAAEDFVIPESYRKGVSVWAR